MPMLLGGLVVVLLVLAGVAAALSRTLKEHDALQQAVIERALRLRQLWDQPCEPGDVGNALTSLDDLGSWLQARLGKPWASGKAFQKFIDASPGALIVVRNDGHLVAANSGASSLLGMNHNQLMHRLVHEVFTQREMIELYEQARVTSPSDSPGMTIHVQRMRVAREDGTRILEVSACSTGPEVVLTLLDVTDLSLAGDLKGDFVANASHELRTPICAILAAVQTAQQLSSDEDSTLAQLHAMIQKHTQRLNALVEDLMELSLLEAPGSELCIEPLEIGELFEELESLFEGVCEARGLRLSLEIDEEFGSIHSDRKSLYLILKNLIENATRFAFETTTIRVQVKRVEDSEGRGVRLSVIDQGIGIPLDEQGRIFERFYQVDRSRTGSGQGSRGTGLGLAIVRHAVRGLGGSVRVESIWQQGTTVSVELPDGGTATTGKST